MLRFQHINSGNIVEVNQTSYILEEPPYASIAQHRYKIANQILIDAVATELQRKYNGQVTIQDLGSRKVLFLSTIYEEQRALIIDPECDWNTFMENILTNVKSFGFKNPDDIFDVAISQQPFYNPLSTKVVNTQNPKKSPYDSFPQYAILYVNMLKRSKGWIPIAVGLMGCYGCGSLEQDMGRKFKCCARCHKAKYCSVECQKEDWKRHKMECTPKK